MSTPDVLPQCPKHGTLLLRNTASGILWCVTCVRERGSAEPWKLIAP